MRTDGRNYSEIRPVSIETDFIQNAEGSALIKMGNTHVICTASYESNVPKWMSGSGKGWLTAEYGMLPRSTHQRMKREKAMNSGRTQEISRLIGRSLRAAIDLKKLGERQIIIDCDVIQADGGTRTAAITGGYVALCSLIDYLINKGELEQSPIIRPVAAISIGLRNDDLLVDLNYDEDSTIDTDMNFVFSEKGQIIEIQGTAEGTPFHKDHIDQMFSLIATVSPSLFNAQNKALEVSL